MIKKERKKHKKKESKDNINTESNKDKKTGIEEKGLLPITRHEINKRKDINQWKQRKCKSKINQRIEQNDEIGRRKQDDQKR